MEKLVAPRKAITAHVRVLRAPEDWFALDWTARRDWIDARVASDSRRRLEGGFTPLPLLGVPGWWPGQDADFYPDQTVFRPKRPQLTKEDA